MNIFTQDEEYRFCNKFQISFHLQGQYNYLTIINILLMQSNNGSTSVPLGVPQSRKATFHLFGGHFSLYGTEANEERSR